MLSVGFTKNLCYFRFRAGVVGGIKRVKGVVWITSDMKLRYRQVALALSRSLHTDAALKAGGPLRNLRLGFRV